MKVKIAINRIPMIEKPEKLDWQLFNNSFENHELDFGDLCNAIYVGKSFCGWMNGIRNKDNFVCAQHIGIDMDTQDYTSSIDALAEHPMVQAYGALIYQTPSHKPAAPKSRVVFILDRPIDTVMGYELALETMYSLFDGADRACIDAARFFFGNGMLGYRKNTNGIWFNKEEPLLPLADLRILAKQYNANIRRQQEENQSQTRQAVERTINAAKSGNGDAPALDELRDLLGQVNPYALDYVMWLKTVAGLAHEYGEAAFGVAKEWSDAPGKKPLTRQKWDSLNRDHSQPATIATVMKVIQEYGRR